MREALRAEVTCIDVAGAMASTPEVPLRVAAFGAGSDARTAPLLVAPPGAALAWAAPGERFSAGFAITVR